MVYCVPDNDILLRNVRKLGIEINKEQIDAIVTEAFDKDEEPKDLEKMHPLSRAFINLAKNKEKSNDFVLQVP